MADDHAPLRVGVRIVLEQAGYEIVEAATAQEAIEVAAGNRPDVCLIDLGMPGGGLTAVEGIYGHDPYAKIVVLTGSIDDQDVFDAVRAGAVGYLVKGIDESGLVQALEAVIRGESALPQRLLMLLMGLSVIPGGQTVVLPSGGVARLTPRETQVLGYLREGLRTREIAAHLGLSPITVRRHISGVLHKLDAPTREAAIAALNASPPATNEAT